MSGQREPEDLAAFDVLDELAQSAGTRAIEVVREPVSDDTSPIDLLEPPADDEALEVLRRLYLESAGLLAYQLDPVAPRPETRGKLLANLVGDETQDVSPWLGTAAPRVVEEAPPAPVAEAAAPSRIEAPTAAVSPAEPARANGVPRVSAREPRARAARGRGWPLALAALFALAAIGLGVWAAQLNSEVAYRDAQIRSLRSDLERSASLERDLAEAKAQLTRFENRLSFVTAPATTVFALRPPVGARQPLARGHLFVAANQRDWRLEVRGLSPDLEVQDYQLWFIVDGIPLSAGVFDARAGQVADLADGDLPAGATAIAITLEKKGGSRSPTSPILLLADSSVRI